MNTIQQKKIYYTLRIASAMCFIGHGTFGIITKEIWTHYFGVFGIGHTTSYQLMPWVGCIDVLMGLTILIYPLRAVILWLVIWGTITALLRPLSGEPFAEFIERAGNFGAPLILIILSGNIRTNIKSPFTPLSFKNVMSENTLQRAIIGLRIVVFFLFLGHGWLNLIEKKSLLSQYASLGFTNPSYCAQVIGIFEIIAAFVVLIRPVKQLVFAFFIWKVVSEFFYPHYELFEWIERGGSYGCLLALWFALDASTNIVTNKKQINNLNQSLFNCLHIKHTSKQFKNINYQNLQ